MNEYLHSFGDSVVSVGLHAIDLLSVVLETAGELHLGGTAAGHELWFEQKVTSGEHGILV